MRIYAIVAVAALGVSAQADIIKCQFTEPFITTTYSTTTQIFTAVEATENKVVQQEKNASFQIMGPAKFEIRDKKGNVIQKLELNNQGSDGMSDRVFPYDVEWVGQAGTNAQWGGCTSNYLKATDPQP